MSPLRKARRIHVWMAWALCTACTGAGSATPRTDGTPAADGGGGVDAAAEADAAEVEPAGSPADASAREVGDAAAGGPNPTPEAPHPRPDVHDRTQTGQAQGEDDSGTPDPRDEADPEVPRDEDPPRSTEPVGPDQPVIPDETADADALRRLADWHALPELGNGQYRQYGSSDRRQPSDGLEDVLPLFGFGNRDLNNFVCRSLDADLFHSPLIPFTYDRGLCVEPYVRGVVMARYEGSGRLVRTWMTVASLAVERELANEVLRVYVDDNPRPLIQAKLADVFSGKAGAIFAPPFGAGSKNFLAWYYPVVFSKKLILAIDRLTSEYYHQTDVVLDARPQKRVAPSRRIPERDRVVQQLTAASPVSPDAVSLAAQHVSLARGESTSVQLSGPATIQEVRLRVSRLALQRLAGVQLSVRWDGRTEPAIDLPLRELFAAGHQIPERSNAMLAATTDGGVHRLALRLPMPFPASASWTFTQRGIGTAEFDFEWIGIAGVPNEDFGQLSVQRIETALPTTHLEQPVARVSGRGRYVGLCADLAGESEDSLGALSAGPLNILEGDFRATADGKLAIDGTGTEDYPDNAFYFLDSPSATPFAQNWGLVDDASQTPAGRVSFCRWQILGNEIDFQSEFVLTHEMAVQDPSIVRLHRTVAYLYVAP